LRFARECLFSPVFTVPGLAKNLSRQSIEWRVRTEPGPTRNDRKKIEMLFAHLKRVLKLDRLRLEAKPPRLITATRHLGRDDGKKTKK
jgi:hypothetical protein